GGAGDNKRGVEQGRQRVDPGNAGATSSESHLVPPLGSQASGIQRDRRTSSRRATFTLLNNDIAAGRLSAFGAHSAFRFGAHAESDTADHHTHTGRWTFLDNPATLRS